jgi:hypothetical protein
MKTMTRMVRKQIYIEPRQEAILKRLARETGETEAEIIRRVIDRQSVGQVNRRRDLRSWELERAFILRRMAEERIPGKRTWNREELHER